MNFPVSPGTPYSTEVNELMRAPLNLVNHKVLYDKVLLVVADNTIIDKEIKKPLLLKCMWKVARLNIYIGINTMYALYETTF